MNNEKIVLQSPQPLNAGENNGTKLYAIAAACGLILGVLLCLSGGTFNLPIILMFIILSLLVGWGIRNKMLKYKSFGLRRMRFLVDEKPDYPELYQRLLPVFNSINIKMEMNEEGSICILYDGLYYDVVFNEDDTFSVLWRQSFLKSFLRQGYYITVYKKVSIAMGLIAYHVQKVCLGNGENYYVTAENTGISNSFFKSNEVKKGNRNIAIIVTVCIVIAVIGICIWTFLYELAMEVLYRGVTGEPQYSSEVYTDLVNSMDDDMYAAIIEEYACDTGSYSMNDIYELLEVYTENYHESGTMNFVDMTGWKAGLYMNDYMRYNDDYIGTGVIMEGEIMAKSGNVIEILDTPAFEEYSQIYDAGYTGTNDSVYFGADIGLTGSSSDAFFVGDQVQIVGVYCGKIAMTDGNYAPAIVAIDVYTMNSDY